MSTLKTTLDNLQVRTFADPIHYSSGSYFENRILIIKESDNKILKHYAHIARTRYLDDGIPECYEDVNDFLADVYSTTSEDILEKRKDIGDLDGLQYNKMFIYADAHMEKIVSDDIFWNDEEIYKLLKREEYILIGPEVDDDGKYIKFEGNESQRLDFFGKPLKSANYKYFASNREYINDVMCFNRTISFNNGDFYEKLTFYKNKDRGLLLVEDEYGESRYMYDGELMDTIQFVSDLDSNVDIIRKVMEYIDDLEEYGVFEITEDHLGQKVGYENPIKLTITKSENE